MWVAGDILFSRIIQIIVHHVTTLSHDVAILFINVFHTNCDLDSAYETHYLNLV